MAKRKFKATEGLLHDVMRKQSGVIQKAWLEALMNGVDANASEIHFEIDEKSTHYWDDGDSMTQSEVEQYFEQFGLKDSDIEDKEFGKFRMGRGQIFNFGLNIWRAKENYMVVSLDDDEAEVHLPNCTQEEDESILAREGELYCLDTSGLSYALLSAEHIDEGIDITVKHYDPIDGLEATLNEFKKLARYVPWVHGVDVYINDEKLEGEPEVIEETKNAYYCEAHTDHSTYSPVYNKGALVDEFDLGPASIMVITKEDLDVTLDRTDILDHDKYWQAVKEEHKAITVRYLIEKDQPSTQQINWLIEQAASNPSVLDAIMEQPLLEDISGDRWTLNELAGKRLGFASKDDGVAQDAMERGNAIILNEDHQDSFEHLAGSQDSNVESDDIDSYKDIVDKNLAFEMKEVSYGELSKRRQQSLRTIESAMYDLGFTLNVKAGFSNHKDVWKDDEGNLYIHKDMLNSKKKKLATDVILHVVKIASHDGETMSSFDENFRLNRNFYRNVMGQQFGADVDLATVQQRILNNQY